MDVGICGSILIVEDDAGIRESLHLLLESENYHVMAAANGKEALDLLKSGPHPGLILLDLMMPVMNGWEFLDAIKEDSVVSAIPVIVVTAFSEEARGMQVKRVLKKPVDFDLLLTIVKQHCVGS